jgi:peptidoglycan/LPS O-acetylase OafA/YrhL
MNQLQPVSKNIRIDTLRGLACILLVLYHIIGINEQTGIRISEGLLRDFNDALAYIRMPLFTFLSGYVYAFRPFTGHTCQFIKGKSRRLLLPMLVAGTLFAVIQSLTPGANGAIENWALLHIIPVAHFWFVEALFLIFIGIAALEKFKLFTTKTKTVLVIVVACLLFLSPLNTRYLAVSGALYLLPFFLSGMFLKRFYTVIPAKLGLGIVAVVAIGIYLKYPNLHVSKYDRDIFTLVVGIAVCIGLLALGLKNKLLSFVGRYSYAIYIYHVFFTAACRITLQKIGVVDQFMLITVSLLFGLAGPMVTEFILNKNAYTKTLFLGKKLNKNTNLAS